MRFLTRPQFQKQVVDFKAFEYWVKVDRWDYFSVAIDFAKAVYPKRVLEAGAYGISICLDSVTLDKKTFSNYPDVVWDLNNTPYPFRDKQFDLFAALQVFEHVQEKAKAFKEASRIAKHIILSLPYNLKGNTVHSNLGDAQIKEWFGKPDKKQVVGSRVVCYWGLE